MPDPQVFSRLQWSKSGITAYDEKGSFIFRLEGWMVPMMTRAIIIGLSQIEKERIRRETYHAVQKPFAAEGSLLGSVGQGDAGQGSRVGDGDAEPEEPSGAREAAEAEEEVTGAPV